MHICVLLYICICPNSVLWDGLETMTPSSHKHILALRSWHLNIVFLKEPAQGSLEELAQGKYKMRLEHVKVTV